VLGGLLLGLGAILAWYGAWPPLADSRPPVTPESGVVQPNLTYCTADGVALKLDLYLPQRFDERPVPVVLYVHGGGWQEGDKTWISRILPAERLVARGYAVAAINYRLAPRSHWPAQIADAKCAVRFLRAQAARYQLDPERIGVWGESAGGHLAALLGLAGPAAGLEGTGGYAGQSSRVAAVVDMCGPTDFGSLPLDLPNRLLAQVLLGTQPGPALLRQVSPISYVAPGAPPFLILQGAKDTLVAPDQSHRLYNALRAAGAPATLVLVQNAGHVFAPVGGPISPTIAQIDQQVVDFFDTSLQQADGGQTLPQTGKTVRGPFLAAWQTTGARAQWGYPVSDALQEISPTDHQRYIVQYFQRAVLEWHPGPAGTVQPQPLGAWRYRLRYPHGAPGQVPNPRPGAIQPAPGGPWVGGAFLAAWHQDGGLTSLGRPLSDEFPEVSALDGQLYTVQYFERAVLEWHPAIRPVGQVLLAQLGTFQYTARYLPLADR